MAEGGKETLGYNPEGWAKDIPGEYSKWKFSARTGGEPTRSVMDAIRNFYPAMLFWLEKFPNLLRMSRCETYAVSLSACAEYPVADAISFQVRDVV